MTITRIHKALFALSVLMILVGCGANHEVRMERDPKGLFDHAMSSYRDEKVVEAESLFKRVMEDHPLSPYAVEAQLMLGDICYMNDRYEEAASYYTNFSAMHPAHPKAAYAYFQKGMSHFKNILSADRDQTATKKALFAFQDLLKSYPESPYGVKATELIGFLKKRLAEREFYVAKFYYKGKNYKGALSRLRDILKVYPDAGLSDETLYYIGESYSHLGEERLAKDAFSSLLREYPDSPYAGDATELVK